MASTEFGGKTARSFWPSASARLSAYIASICAFQLSMRSSRSMARMPTLMDSTMFSLNSFRRSNSLIFVSQPRVEAGVLQGDADVAGQRFQQLHVFAGEEVAAHRAAQADHGDGAAVIAIRPARGRAGSSSGRAGRPCAAGLGGRCRACCAFSRKMCEWSTACAVEVEETESQPSALRRGGVERQAMRAASRSRPVSVCAGKTATRETSSVAAGARRSNPAAHRDRSRNSGRGRTRSAPGDSRSDGGRRRDRPSPECAASAGRRLRGHHQNRRSPVPHSRIASGSALWTSSADERNDAEVAAQQQYRSPAYRRRRA